MTSFRVWAPLPTSVDLQLGERRLPMRREADGWWETDASDVPPDQDYAFVLDGGQPRPDPRSMWQPYGVQGPSRLLSHDAFTWHDDAWRGVPLTGSVFYEMHVGTFTPEGTFDAAIGRLDHLVDLGVDIVELLPVNAFDGPRGWGYDGVDWYAVHEPYGGPDGLKRFVDAAHGRGLGVALDVVYNHLGPSGNYLSDFGPYFTDQHQTPWGPAVNLDAPGSDEVRRYILDNVAMWLRDYHIDGLRLDAVHALKDDRALHLLEELEGEVAALRGLLGKPLFLVAESDRNDPRTVMPWEAGGLGLDAQWSDDFHHAVHALLTGERQGYYCDFGSLETLAKALTSVFVHDGTYSTFRGRHHGRPVDRNLQSALRFLGYLQNHDQVGNRAIGRRMTQLVSPGLLKVGAALVLTSPFTPMLFMGEEWGASTAWQYFTSFPDAGLADAVRNGRRSEFAAHGWNTDEVPDPQAEDTFRDSQLDWSEPDREPHRDLLGWHRRLIALRRSYPELADGRLADVQCTFDEQARWFVLRRGRVAVVCNLAQERQSVPVDGAPATVEAASSPGFAYSDGAVELAAESVVVAVLA